MQPKSGNAITIAVSSRVLFNMEKEQHIFEERGLEEYIKYQVKHEAEPFSPGPAFCFVKVILLQTLCSLHSCSSLFPRQLTHDLVCFLMSRLKASSKSTVIIGLNKKIKVNDEVTVQPNEQIMHFNIMLLMKVKE